MSKYTQISEKINQLDEIYMKAKEYDKITRYGDNPLRCVFCGRPSNKVEQLIMGNSSVGICEECVAFCDFLCKEKLGDNYDKIKEKVINKYKFE